MDGELSGRVQDGFKPPRAGKILSLAAVCLATAVPILMGVRPIAINEDLGYHLAMGDEFLATGKISDTCPYIFMNNPSERHPPGPGGWYDQEGRYHFVMASWTIQIVMSLINRLAGFNGLSVFSSLLIAGIIIQVLVLMRRIGLPAALQAAAMLLIGLTAYERFNLRPELVGYNLFIGQLLILVFALGLAGEPEKKISWRAVAAVAALQLIFTNVHANSTLGFGPTLAFLADAAIRFFWRRFARRGEEKNLTVARSNFTRLCSLLALQIAVSFVNPWPWRLAVTLPYEQVSVVGELRARESAPESQQHPWTVVGELLSPFDRKEFGDAVSTYGLMAVLGLSATGIICSLAGRQWRMLFLLLGMSAAAISIRRHLAVCAFILAPASLYAIRLAARAIASRFHPPDFKKAANICLAMLAAASAWLVCMVVTNRFYHHEDMGVRFGTGISGLMMPVGVADWLNEHNPKGRLWADFNISSTMYYLTTPHRDVPLTTNGWAYPPDVMKKFARYMRGDIPFDEAVSDYGLNVAALHLYSGTLTLARKLRSHPRWTVVYIDAKNVIFVRNNGPNQTLARECGIAEEKFDEKEYIARILRTDKYPDFVLRAGTATLYNLGWFSAAIGVAHETLKVDSSRHEIWHVVGVCHAMRGTRRIIEGTLRQEKDRTGAGECFQKGRGDLLKAGEYFRKALEIRPDFSDAKNDLEFLNSQIEALDKGLPPIVPANFDYYPPELLRERKTPGDAAGER
ncbi:MAG: hypothetical protein HZA50_05205 [Planctomycetes bacterium]|nr:hypothetical protein [Planctomycetota bacterium]